MTYQTPWSLKKNNYITSSSMLIFDMKWVGLSLWSCIMTYSRYKNKEENAEGTENLFLYRQIFVTSLFARSIFDCTSFWCQNKMIMSFFNFESARGAKYREYGKRLCFLLRFQAIWRKKRLAMSISWLLQARSNYKMCRANL